MRATVRLFITSPSISGVAVHGHGQGIGAQALRADGDVYIQPTARSEVKKFLARLAGPYPPLPVRRQACMASSMYPSYAGEIRVVAAGPEDRPFDSYVSFVPRQRR